MSKRKRPAGADGTGDGAAEDPSKKPRASDDTNIVKESSTTPDAGSATASVGGADDSASASAGKSASAAASAATAAASGAVPAPTPIVRAFVEHLADMLAKFPSCIAWTRGGTAIDIVDPDKFSKDVLPQYFNHSNVPSFVRQLNMYGFTKTVNDPKVKEFGHPKFLRGRPELLSQIVRRKKVTKGGASARTSTTEALRQQRGQLEALVKQMAAMQNRQAALQSRVEQMQQENAKMVEQNQELNKINNMLREKNDQTMATQQNLQGRLQQTFQFMVQLYEQLQGQRRGLRPGTAMLPAKQQPLALPAPPRGLRRLPSDLEKISTDDPIFDPVPLSRKPSSVAPAAASAQKQQQEQERPPRKLQRLNSKDSLYFKNDLTEDMQAAIATLGLDVPTAVPVASLVSNAGQQTPHGLSEGKVIAGKVPSSEPQGLRKLSSFRSFLKSTPDSPASPANNLSSAPRLLSRVDSEILDADLNTMSQEQEAVGERLNFLQRNLSSSLQAQSFDDLLTDPSLLQRLESADADSGAGDQ